MIAPSHNSIAPESRLSGRRPGEIGRRLLEGKPHIMSHAEGEGHSFVIRPVALKPGEYKIVAQRLYEIFQAVRLTAMLDIEAVPALSA